MTIDPNDFQIFKSVKVNSFYYALRQLDTLLHLLFKAPFMLCQLNATNACLGIPAGVDGNDDIIFYEPGGLFYRNPRNVIEYDL